MAHKQIAVVNDDTVFLDLMHELLTEEGYSVSVCKASEKAYLFIKKEQPDLIILDVRVGNEGAAWTTLDLIDLDPATTHIPVIVCSTDRRQLEAKAEYMREQGYEMQEKPFRLEDLLSKVERFVGPAAA